MKLNSFIIRFITFKYNLEINKMGKKNIKWHVQKILFKTTDKNDI